MEDFYFLERDDGTEGSGKFDIGGKTVNFYAWSYGGMYRINIDGTVYPSINIHGDSNEPVSYSFEGTHTKAGETKTLTGKEWPDEVPVSENDPSVLIGRKLEALCRTAAEHAASEDVPFQIAQEMDKLDDDDEFEEDHGMGVTLFHIVDNRKIFVRNVLGDEDPEEIKELPTTKKLPYPPLPKGLHYDKDAYRKKPRKPNTRFDEYEPNPDYTPPWA